MAPGAGVTRKQLRPELRPSGGSQLEGHSPSPCILSHQTLGAYPDLTLGPSRRSLLPCGGSCIGTEAGTHHLLWLGLLGTCRHGPRFPFLSSRGILCSSVGLFPLSFVPGLPFPTILFPARRSKLSSLQIAWFLGFSPLPSLAKVLSIECVKKLSHFRKERNLCS